MSEEEKTEIRLVEDEDELELSPLSPEKRKAIDCIVKKPRLTAPELAEESGLSTSHASYWLNKIAGETGARLEVAEDGRVFYTFVDDFRSIYRVKGFERKLRELGVFLFNALYYIIRASFGVALILSVLVIILLAVALIVIVIASIFEGGHGHGGDIGGGGGHGDIGGGGSHGDVGSSSGGGHGSSGDIGFFDLQFLGDLFSWDFSPSHSYYGNSLPSARRDEYSDFVKKHPAGNFFLECFSFMFGDGKPNSNLAEVRWRKIATMIKAHGGVVSAEQLAPYLDGDTSDSGMVMHALAQYNGHPEVTPSGYIVYVFPDFVTRDTATEKADDYLQEDHWKFSSFSPLALTNVFLLAVFNLAGSWWLFKHIATINLLHDFAALIDVLLTYAIVLLAIPLIRYVVITLLNLGIDERNEKRRAAHALVTSPVGAVLEEINEARALREELAPKLTDGKIIYDSSRDQLEQKFEMGKDLRE